MQLLVISSPVPVENEAGIINALFDAGLQRFHLRRYDASEDEITCLLREIEPAFHPKIVLHQHYSQCEQFRIKGIHFSESKRLQANEDELEQWKEKDFMLSTSIHKMDDHHTLPGYFDYTFFGPVFESISKQGYKPVPEQIPRLKNVKRKTKIMALGGISPANIESVKLAHYDGAAVLGAIWSDPVNAVKVLESCLEKCN